MKKKSTLPFFLKFYHFIWLPALPLLKTSKRLKQGFEQRRSCDHLSKADLWIQAASAGEAYLAVELVKSLSPHQKTKILLTTTTSQGMDILTKSLEKELINKHICIQTAWFPFDMPSIMKKAAARVNPEIMVLLETEIWPALICSLKQNRTAVWIINGRLSEKSLKSYLYAPWLWKKLAPDLIMAIDWENAQRYKKLFNTSEVCLMKNIKFDSLVEKNQNRPIDFSCVIKPDTLLSILASVRMEEEMDAAVILERIMAQNLNQVTAVFPRHMHRLFFWKDKLTAMGVNWQLKSSIKAPVENNTVILWDTFGELKQAYSLATAVFVGGSLKPLGGQNFIEPVICGAATVTGPFLDNFSFAGKALFKDKTVKKARSPLDVADFMIQVLRNPPDRKIIAKKGKKYIKANQGGTKTACSALENRLKNHSRSLFSIVF